MKPGPVTKLNTRSKTTSKKIYDDAMWQNSDVITIFQSTANLEQSGSRIPDT